MNTRLIGNRRFIFHRIASDFVLFSTTGEHFSKAPPLALIDLLLYIGIYICVCENVYHVPCFKS